MTERIIQLSLKLPEKQATPPKDTITVLLPGTREELEVNLGSAIPIPAHQNLRGLTCNSLIAKVILFNPNRTDPESEASLYAKCTQCSFITPLIEVD